MSQACIIFGKDEGLTHKYEKERWR